MSAGTAFLGLAGPVGWTIAGVAGAAAIGSGIYANHKNKETADKLLLERQNVEVLIRKFNVKNAEVAALTEATQTQIDGVQRANAAVTDKNTADKHAIDNNVAQGIAAYIDYLNQLRVSTLMDTLRQILNNETGQLKDLAERQANALRNLDLANQNVMNIVNSGRGGENGMHGFIAEFAQTGIAKVVPEGLRT